MDESTWWEREGSFVYLLCIYAYTDSTSVPVIDSSYEKLKEDVLSFKQKGRVVLLGTSMLILSCLNSCKCEVLSERR